MRSALGRLLLGGGLWMYVGMPTVAVAGVPDFHVTLECSADFYLPAETVFATWTNDTDSTVVAGNHPPYGIYHAGTGEEVCQGGLPWEFHLGPHSSALLDWDQSDCEFNLVPPGEYIMRIWYVFNDSPPGFMVQDRFEILGPASAPEEMPAIPIASWGRLKMMYR